MWFVVWCFFYLLELVIFFVCCLVFFAVRVFGLGVDCSVLCGMDEVINVDAVMVLIKMNKAVYG